MPDEDDQTRTRFENFTAAPAWRALPLQIRLLVLRIWRTEKDKPPAEAANEPSVKDR